MNDNNTNNDNNAFTSLSKSHLPKHPKHKKMHILVPKRSQLKKRLKINDELFYDFIKGLLEIDPNQRYITIKLYFIFID